jgi:hypothetical protein
MKLMNIFNKQKFLSTKINTILIISLVNFVVGFLIAWLMWSSTFAYAIKMASFN